VMQSILKKFPIIQYDCQKTPKSSFDGSVDSFEEKEKACVETHTRNHNHTCPVCTEDFVQYQLLRVLPCGHQYHVKCIEDWLARGSNCPVWYVSTFHPSRWRCSLNLFTNLFTAASISSLRRKRRLPRRLK
jgi:hypothetical protein